jgi:hypothetical protein
LMRWVRSNTRFASWLALFALALQLTFSFDHLHLDARIHKSATPFAAALAVNLSSASARVPDQPVKHSDFGDFCAICAVVHMASSSLPATPPTLPTQDLFVRERMGVNFEARIIASPRRSAQARAPPVT